jgi:hypothetical protein
MEMTIKPKNPWPNILPGVLFPWRKSAWARLIKKVYGVDPLVCPCCGSEKKIIAVIMDPTEIEKILQHLVKIGRAPPGLDLTNMDN